MGLFTRIAHGFYRQRLAPNAAINGGAEEFVFEQKFSNPVFPVKGPGVDVFYDFAPTSPAVVSTAPTSVPMPIVRPTNTPVPVEFPEGIAPMPAVIE